MSDGQERLFALGRAVEPLRPMTVRQARIYDLICAQPHGVEAIELGALMHEADGRHHRERFCRWCSQDGARALKERAIKERVVRHGTVYEPRDRKDWVGLKEIVQPGQLTALPGETFEDIFGGNAA